MSRESNWLSIMIVLFVATVVGPGSMAADPNKDLAVQQWEGAPACNFVDGGVIIDNNSSSYYYRISVTIAVHVPDGPGTLECSGDPDNCAEDCSEEKTACTCSVSGALYTIAPNVQNQTMGCALPNCQGDCCTDCDNTNEGCEPASHCTSVLRNGSYYYVQWSTDGINWTDFIDQSTISMVGAQQSSNCP